MSRSYFAALWLMVLCVFWASCSRCGGRPGEEAVDTAERLVWELMPLGQARDALEKALPDVLSDDKGEGGLACDESIELPVLDIEEKRIEVRYAQGHRLERCVRRGTLAGDPEKPLRLKADFVDDLLARVEIVVPKEMVEPLAEELTGRFGAPDEVELVADDLLADPVSHRCWRPEEDVVWTLSQTHREGGAFVLQHLPVSRRLPSPRGAAKPGTPVSLDDLGFGSGEVDTAVLEQLAKDSD